MAELTISLGKNKVGSLRIQAFGKGYAKNLKRALARGGSVLERQIKRHLTGPSHSIKGRGRGSTSSNPYPGIVSNTLRRSVRFQLTTGGKGVKIGPNTRYAAIHEFGGTIRQKVTAKQRWFLGLNKGIWLAVGSALNIKIPPRPYVKPAWKKKGKSTIRVVQAEIMKPIRGKR